MRIPLTIVLTAIIVISTPVIARNDTGPAGSGLKRFKAMDLNGDGRLSKAEAGELFLMDGFDADGDGFITMREAIAFGRNARKTIGTETRLSAAFLKASDIPYLDQPADPDLQSLDIYGPPAKGATKHPVLVFIHGGGWYMGDKAGSLSQKVPWLARQGWMTVSINYRLSPAVKHPAHIDDVAAAVAWVHDHIATYGGDPNRIVVMGHSAGAHLAALVATDARRLAAHGKTLDVLQGAILLDGAAYDVSSLLKNPRLPRRARVLHEQWVGQNPTDWADASPALNITSGSGTPEFLILHTTRYLGAGQSTVLGQRLRDAGVEAVVVPCQEDSHSSINHDLGQGGHLPTERIAGFLRRIESTRAADRKPASPALPDPPASDDDATSAPPDSGSRPLKNSNAT